jgi:hypothetical protein
MLLCIIAMTAAARYVSIAAHSRPTVSSMVIRAFKTG